MIQLSQNPVLALPALVREYVVLYYLVHGLIVVFCLRALFLVSSGNDLSFWLCLVPVFAFSALGGALLFLFVEKPYSLQQQTEATRLAAIAQYTGRSQLQHQIGHAIFDPQ